MAERTLLAPQAEAILDRMSIDPDICSGKPCIRGTRVMVANILGLFASGYSVERILANYPSITGEDVTGGLHYAAQMIDEEKVYLRSA